MGRLRNKIGVLALVLVLCLASIGASYAMWSETLTIDGTVSLGYVAVQFEDCKTNDPLADPGIKDPTQRGAWTIGDINDTDTWVWSGTRHTFWSNAYTLADIEPVERQLLDINMSGGYPSYSGNVAFSIGNVGTIPVCVEAIQLTEVSKAGLIYTLATPIDLEKDVTWYVYFDGTGPHLDTSLQYDGGGEVISEFSLTLGTLGVEEVVLMPGERIPGDVCYRVELGASASTLYDFVIQIAASQYNE